MCVPVCLHHRVPSNCLHPSPDLSPCIIYNILIVFPPSLFLTVLCLCLYVSLSAVYLCHYLTVAESLRSVSTRPQTTLRALLSSRQLALAPVRALLAQQDTAAKLLHGAASNKQRLLEVAIRDKEQLVKALVVEQAKVVDCLCHCCATLTHLCGPINHSLIHSH